MEDLVNRTLYLGDCIRVGRKSLNEVAINKPYFSGVHCEIDVVFAPLGDGEALTNKLSCRVCDRSSNGTWLVKTNGIPQSSLEKSEVLKRMAVRLKKDVRKELSCGDCVLLLSPLHPDCMQFRFLLERGIHNQQFVFRQLPCSAGDKPGAHSSHTLDRGVTSHCADYKVIMPTSGMKRGAEAIDSPPTTTKLLRLEAEGMDANLVTKEADLQSTNLLDADNKEAEDVGLEHCAGGNNHSSQSNLVPGETHSCLVKSAPAPSLESDKVTSRCVSVLLGLIPSSTAVGPDGTGLQAVADSDPPSSSTIAGIPAAPSSSVMGIPAPPSTPSVSAVSSSGTLTTTDSRPSTCHPTSSEEERCIHCSKLFPIPDLPSHCESCSEKMDVDGSCEVVRSKPSVDPHILEYCPHCLELYPLEELLNHCEECNLVCSDHVTPSEISSLMRDPSYELCPVCHGWFPVLELFSHVDSCTSIGGSKDRLDDGAEDVVEVDGRVSPADPDPARRYTLDTYEGTHVDSSTVSHFSETDTGPKTDTTDVAKVSIIV